MSVLVVAQSSSEIPEGLMNNPVFSRRLLWVGNCVLKNEKNLVSFAVRSEGDDI